MDFRRVQRTGRSTFIISLPKKWADRKLIKSGQVLALSENPDGSLTIALDAKHDFHAKVNADHAFAVRKAVSAYIAGAQHITLFGKRAPTVAENVRQILAAVDVIQENKDEVVLRVFATGTEFTLHTLLKRMHAVCLSLFDLAERAFSENVREAVLSREREMDRLYTLSLRYGGGGFGAASGPAVFGLLVAKGFESIADKISQYALEKPRFGKNVLTAVRTLYEQAAVQYLEGGPEQDVQGAFEALGEELDIVRAKSALEWSRLESAAKHCIEIEEVTEDLRALKESEKT